MSFPLHRLVVGGTLAILPLWSLIAEDNFSAEPAKQSIAKHGIVVCSGPLRTAMTPWIQDRAESGIQVTFVSPAPSPENTRQAVADAVDDSTSFVLLVGDVPNFGSKATPKQIPTFYRDTTVTGRFGSTPTLMTDRPYGDPDGDGLVDLAVGRWPVTSPAEVTGAIKKVLETERCEDFGAWRQRVELVGGIGGFGPMIDMAIESVTRSVLTSSLPKSARPAILYASPGHLFYPKQTTFRDAVVQRFGQGCRFWVYAGHGQINELDHVDDAPILDVESLALLDCQDRRHCIALLLACYTGAIDAPGNDFASQLWRSPDGPVAVVAGSRVTMPYGNSQVALAMIDRVYQSHDETLGQAWLGTQRTLQIDQPAKTTTGKMIDSLAAVITPGGGDLMGEKREHAALYQLIGDPTLRLHPPKSVTVETGAGFEIGEPFVMTFESPIAGIATVSLDTPLGSTHSNDPNERVVHRESLPCEPGRPYSITLATQTIPSGPVELRVHVAGQTGWATGGKQVLAHQAKPK